MTTQEFAQTIKTKYPDYQSIPDEELVSKFLVKYPEYKTQITGGSFISNVGSDLAKRATDLYQTGKDVYEGKQSPVSLGIQAAGQVAGGALDILGEAIKPITSIKPIKDAIQKGGESFLKSKNILGETNAETIKKYEDWANQHPEASKNVSAVTNILSILLPGEGAKTGEKTVGTGLNKLGTTLKTSGETAITEEKKSFIRELVRPAQTKAVKESQVARTTETGFGPFKKSVIAPTKLEAVAEDYVSKIPNVSENNTIQQNFNVIRDANVAEAQKLSSELLKNDFIYPRKELLSRLNKVKETLAKNPTLIGDAEKTAGKLIAEFKRRIEASPSKGSNLLQVRKDFDAWVESQKGGAAFDPTTENAFSIANREIRKTVNTFLDEKAPSAGVKESLKKQSALYTALDNLTPKAAYEADTAFKRFIQKAEQVLGTKNKAVQILAASVGIGGLGAAATFAPAVAGLGIGGYLVYRGGKLVLGPEVRKALGTLSQELSKQGAGKVAGEAVTGGSIAELKNDIDTLLEHYK